MDLGLIKTVLDVLAAAAGRDNYTLEVVTTDSELRQRRPIPVHQVQSAMTECVSRGWATEAVDDFRQATFAITTEGRAKQVHF